MWIFARKGFLSIVRNVPTDGLETEYPSLLVRARFRGDLEAFFPGAKVEELREADYRFRTVLPISAVAYVIEREIMGIDYQNFKAEISASWPDSMIRATAYARVWGVMAGAQDDAAAKMRPAAEPIRMRFGYGADGWRAVKGDPTAAPKARRKRKAKRAKPAGTRTPSRKRRRR